MIGDRSLRRGHRYRCCSSIPTLLRDKPRDRRTETGGASIRNHTLFDRQPVLLLPHNPARPGPTRRLFLVMRTTTCIALATGRAGGAARRSPSSRASADNCVGVGSDSSSSGRARGKIKHGRSSNQTGRPLPMPLEANTRFPWELA